MELLLILSALFSTLTGVVTGARAPALQVQNCTIAAEQARIVAAAVAPRTAGHRHLLGTLDLWPVFAASPALLAVPTIAPRLYLDRLRA